MPYSYPKNVPKVSKKWSASAQKKCTAAANAVLREGGSEQDAIFACIRAAGKTKHPGGKKKMFSALKTALFGIGSKEMSHDEVRNAIYDALPQPAPLLSMDESTRERYYVKAVYDGYAIIESGGQLFRATYKINKKNDLTLGDLKQVEVAYVAIRDKANQIVIGMKSVQSAFTTFKDKQGETRWLMWTASAFEDGEKQIVATKALETYANAAMEIDVHGDIWAFGHFPCRFGEPDIHVVMNKQLFETGGFDDTPDGQALEIYFEKNPGPYEGSYTFLCGKGDDRADVFNWLWILERSVLPVGTAAHPMAKRFNMMSGVRGMSKISDKAEGLLIDAIGEERFKELEADSGRLSELLTQLGIESKAMDGDETGSPDGEGEGSDTEGGGEEPVSSVEGQDAVLKMLTEIDGRLTLLAEGVVEMADAQKSIDGKFVELETQVKSLSEEDDAKIGAFVTSLSARDKAQLVAGKEYRPREAAGLAQKTGVGLSPAEAGEEFQTGLRKDANGLDLALSIFEQVSGRKLDAEGGDGNG